MKAVKKKKRNKPAIVPEFCEPNSPHEYNAGLAEYGGKIGRRQDVIKLHQRITAWRAQLPAMLETLRNAGFDVAMQAGAETNANARIAWCKMFEDAIVESDADFFDAMAALIRHKAAGETKHRGEAEAWREYVRFLHGSVQYSGDGKPLTCATPTKGQIKAAVKKTGIEVTSWPRIFKRLKLEWLPEDKRGRPRAGK